MHRIAVVLLIAIGLPAAAANPQVRIHTSSGETRTRDLPGHAPDRVIVEFREQPLLARAAKGRVRANAASALDSLHEQFANDLESIHHSLRGKVATAGTEDARVQYRYRLAFAGASARADRDALPAIRALPYVRAVYPDRRVRATLEHSVPHIGAPQAWEQFHVRGAGIRVAVVDTGIDYTHPALGGAFGPGHKVAGGYDFVNEDADPADDHGHGTHVAGIVAGSAAPVVGVAPDATLLAYKVLDASGYGLDSWILAAVERLVDPDGNGDPSDRVDVANLSFGRYSANDDPLVAAVERAAAAGVVFCIAAGNAGSPFTVASPAIAPSAITVGASTLGDDPTGFSSNGPALHSWSVKPEVTAPGDAIVSAAVGGGTAEASGTSMAAPHTAGLAALIRQLHPAWTPAEVKSAIVGTARPQWSVIAAGAGRIDAVQALGASLLSSPSTLTFGIATEKTGTWSVTRKFQLTNRGTAARTLSTRAGQSQNGVTVGVSPSKFTLEPGQTQEIRVDLLLRVEDAYPADFQIAVSGHVFVEGPSTSVQVPWLAMFGNFVVAAYGGAGDTYVALFQNGTLVGDGNGAAAAGSIGNEVDVVAITLPPEGQQGRLIVRERQRLDGPTVLTISPDEATFDLVMESVAENGEKLSEIGSMRRGGHWWISQFLTLPSRAVLDYHPAGTLRVSAMTETVIASIEQERHVSWVRQPSGEYGYDNGVHIAALRTLRGVQKSENLSLGAGDWTSGVVAHPCGATICDYSVITNIGARGLVDAPLSSSRGIRSTKVGLASAAADGDLPGVVFTVKETDRPNVSFTKGVSMFSPKIVARDGKLIAQVGPEPWPLDYTPPEGEGELAYGYGPGVIRTAMGIRWKREEFGRPGDEWTVQATPVSSLGEELADDSLRLRVTMFDAAGSRYDGLRIVSDNFRLSEPMREGPHRAEIVQDYRIGATRGTGTLVATLDKATAATAPTFTSLRIENSAGRVSFQLQQHEQARLFFSGRQTTFFERSNEIHTWIDPAATKAWWRPYPGTGPWQPLPVAFLGDNYEGTGSPVGSMFSVDLRAVTSSVRAGVALKLELANEHGTTSWTLEPAFFVSGEKKRRVAR